MSDPSFGLPPEIPPGTSTPVPDDVVISTPASVPAPVPKQTLIDVLGPEAVSESTPDTAPAPTSTSESISALTGVPKSTPAPAPAPTQSMPRIDEPPFERTTPLQPTPQAIVFGIPADQMPSTPPQEPTVQNVPKESTPQQPLQKFGQSADRATEAARRSSIRTLESDAAETIQKKKLSVSGIALAQQERESENAVQKILPEEKSHTVPWVLGGVGLAVLGAIVVVVAYLVQTQGPSVPVVVTPQDALIPGVQETTLDVTDMTHTKLSQTLSALPSAYTQKEGISLVRLVTYEEQEDADGNTMRVVQNVMPEDFFQILSARNTSRLERSLDKLTYFGIISKGGVVSPFLAFDVTSYESAFAGLLEWESALPEDVSFMVRVPAPVPVPVQLPATTTPMSTSTTSATTTATTTSVVPPTVIAVTPAPVPVFKDLSVKNKDTRAYVGTDGQTRILYSFITQKLLVIAQDEATLTALIDYISTARFTR